MITLTPTHYFLTTNGLSPSPCRWVIRPDDQLLYVVITLLVDENATTVHSGVYLALSRP